MSIFNQRVGATVIATICMTSTIKTNEHNVVALSANQGAYVHEEVIELGLIFNRFLKKWTDGQGKMPFTFANTPHCLKTLAQLEQDENTIAEEEQEEYAQLLAYAKEKFIRKTVRFVNCSRNFSKHLYPLIEEDCIKRDRDNSFLRLLIKAEKEASAELFRAKITSFKELYDLCVDLEHLIVDLVYSCPKTLHNFELKIKKIKKLKSLLPDAYQLLKVEESDIDREVLIAEFKKKEIMLFTLDEITLEQVCVIVQNFLQEKNEPTVA